MIRWVLGRLGVTSFDVLRYELKLRLLPGSLWWELQQLEQNPSEGGKMRTALAAATIAVVAALALLAAGRAQAHEATITISCDGVTFTYVKFENEVNTVQETVNDTTTEFTFTGESATHTVPVPAGATSVTAEAHWDGQTIPAGPVTQELQCEQPPPVTCPPGEHNVTTDGGPAKCAPNEKPPTPDFKDLCLNIEGTQKTVPENTTRWHHNCYPNDSQTQPTGDTIFGQQG